MPHYMEYVYRTKTSQQLRIMRSQKYNRLTTLESKRMGWFELREASTIRELLVWIDAELETRRSQPEFDTE